MFEFEAASRTEPQNERATTAIATTEFQSAHVAVFGFVQNASPSRLADVEARKEGLSAYGSMGGELGGTADNTAECSTQLVSADVPRGVIAWICGNVAKWAFQTNTIRVEEVREGVVAVKNNTAWFSVQTNQIIIRSASRRRR
ncbi:hypothetical protein ABW21_db0204576 [Orbilia brochopaga]|nr:hypothetical protein ABW21_db0204576 [Drechslerella brochopaga]